MGIRRRRGQFAGSSRIGSGREPGRRRAGRQIGAARNAGPRFGARRPVHASAESRPQARKPRAARRNDLSAHPSCRSPHAIVPHPPFARARPLRPWRRGHPRRPTRRRAGPQSDGRGGKRQQLRHGPRNPPRGRAGGGRRDSDPPAGRAGPADLGVDPGELPRAAMVRGGQVRAVHALGPLFGPRPPQRVVREAHVRGRRATGTGNISGPRTSSATRTSSRCSPPRSSIPTPGPSSSASPAPAMSSPPPSTTTSSRSGTARSPRTTRCGWGRTAT